MSFEFYRWQLEGDYVASVTGPHVDNSDPENPVLPEFVLKSVYDLAIINKADIDGGGTVGGDWWQDAVFSDVLTNNKRVYRVLPDRIVWGNYQLEQHVFEVIDANNLKIKVGADEGYILNTLNFDAAQFDTAIPDWSTDLEQATNF